MKKPGVESQASEVKARHQMAHPDVWAKNLEAP
jgi:hypothetical protein